MTRSLTYYITLFVIRFKGIKKIFSQSPINYLELRKTDIHFPKNKFFGLKKVTTFLIAETTITQLNSNSNNNRLLIYIHGGAFVSGPAQHHWDTIEKIARATDYSIWMCDYPKAPENKISTLSSNIDCIYDFAISKFNSQNITMIGDSVGGTLIVALTQRLIKNNQILPSKLILISPVMDASFENPQIDELEKKDPMLSKKGVLSAKKLCIEDGNLKDLSISPLYGSFEGFPATHLFIAENDITYPDQLLLFEKLESSGIENSIYIGEGMPHIWPLLPVMKESKSALNKIISLLNK